MLNNIKGCAEALREIAPEIDILINEPMRRHTTFSIGGPADLFILPKTRRELIGALEVLRAQGVPMLLLGNGSNILVSDEGVRGAVVKPHGNSTGHAFFCCLRQARQMLAGNVVEIIEQLEQIEGGNENV